MSRDQQRYSIANQSDAIAEYAAKHRMQVVRTYMDAGVSGLTLQKRAGLLALLDDVQGGAADFDIVIAYDVSRWGRFQDTDEAAFYEFMCRRAGIQVVYCAEVFENDGTAISSLLKTLKRHMAAEFSRDLSTKVNRGQRKQAQLGYYGGGTAPYGIRRMLVDSRGGQRGILERGDWKALKGDRIVLVPGPAQEVETVRWAFRLFADEGRLTSEIAGILNSKGLKTASGGAWRQQSILAMIKNERYLGTNIYGRVASSLGGGRSRAPVEDWVRVEGAFEPIIPRELFDRAQTRLVRRPNNMSLSQFADQLRQLHARTGKVSSKSINAEPGLPCAKTFRRKFGSMQAAYEAAGVRVVCNATALVIQADLRAQLINAWRRRGTSVEPCGKASFKLDDSWTLSLFVTTRLHGRRTKVWDVQLKGRMPADITMIVLAEPYLKGEENVLVIPGLSGARFYRRRDDPCLDAFRCKGFAAAFERVNDIAQRKAAERQMRLSTVKQSVE